MDRLLLVTIDLEMLRSHLAAEDEYPHSDAYVLSWLASAGFTFVGGGTWSVREADLGHLDRAEYEVIESVGAELAYLN